MWPNISTQRNDGMKELRDSNQIRERVPWPWYISPHAQICTGWIKHTHLRCGRSFHCDLREPPSDLCPECRRKEME